MLDTLREIVICARDEEGKDDIAKSAHALKSMSVNVGARLLGESCAAIEQAARTGAPVE